MTTSHVRTLSVGVVALFGSATVEAQILTSPGRDGWKVPGPQEVDTRQGTIAVHQVITRIDSGMSNVVIRLRDTDGVFELDMQKLGDESYRTEKLMAFETSAVAQRYYRDVKAVETRVTGDPNLAEVTSLLHATWFDVFLGDVDGARTRYGVRWNAKPGLRPAQRRPQRERVDCFREFVEASSFAFDSFQNCSNAYMHQRWYSSARLTGWYGASCGVEFVMRGASAYGNFFNCSHIQVGPAGPSIG